MLGTRRTKQASRRNLSFGEKGSVNPASLRYPEVAEDETLVPVRKVLHDFEQREGARGFITYTIFFAIYFALNAYRFDASEGRRTITWFNEALKSQYDLVADETNGWCAWDAGGLECYEPYLERADIDGLEHFLESDLTQVVSGILEYCDECLIGMSEVSKDLRDTPLSQFLCVDFETLPETAFAIGAGKATFSKRDCKKVDDDFKSSPSPLEAPCCHDASVRYASQALMATFETQGEWAAVKGLTYADLQPSKRTRKALKDYTARALENDANKNTLIQIVILRGGHATGIVRAAAQSARARARPRSAPPWARGADSGRARVHAPCARAGLWRHLRRPEVPQGARRAARALLVLLLRRRLCRRDHAGVHDGHVDPVARARAARDLEQRVPAGQPAVGGAAPVHALHRVALHHRAHPARGHAHRGRAGRLRVPGIDA